MDGENYSAVKIDYIYSDHIRCAPTRTFNTVLLEYDNYTTNINKCFILFACGRECIVSNNF